MTKNSEKTSLKFMVISAIALIMVFGAAAPAIIPAYASHDETFDITIDKVTNCSDAVLFVQLNCSVWITNTGTDPTIIVETIPAGMDVDDVDNDGHTGVCTVDKASKGGDNSRSGNSKGKNNSATKVVCELLPGESVHIEISSNMNNGNKQRPTSCGAGDDFEVNGGVDAFAGDGSGNLILVQLHLEDGTPVDGDGNVVSEGDFLVPILVTSTPEVFVDVACPV
jgi:hypothetical protein